MNSMSLKESVTIRPSRGLGLGEGWTSPRGRGYYAMPDEHDDVDYSSDEEDFYDNYEPFEEESFDNGEYEAFNPEEEEKEHRSYISPRATKTIKPTRYWNSPKKDEQKKSSPTPTWWDKSESVPETNRIINGVLNYAALLPPPAKKTQTQSQSKKRNRKQQKSKPRSEVATTSEAKQTRSQQKSKRSEVAPSETRRSEVQKPTRFCLSVIKNTKCFHAQCRFAHSYSELKECKFADNCNKIALLKTNQDGTVELCNKNGAACTFKHSKESKHSYLKRVPQQRLSSPKK